MKPRIAVMGSLNMDLVVQVENFPKPGQTVLGGDLAYIPGGKGANQAVAAGRLGADVAMIGKVGNDTFAKVLIDNLLENGIDIKGVETEICSTGAALINVTNTGENQIVVSPGANAFVDASLVVQNTELIKKAQVLLVQLETSLESVIKAVEIATSNDTLVILNPAPAQALPQELLAKVDILTPNETELQLLSGLPVETLEETKTACAALLAKGVKCVVTTLGDKGALACTINEITHVPGYSVSKVVDTTAAGDSFSGALAVALGEKKDLVRAIDFANKVGALTVTKRGAQTSLPSLEDVQKFEGGK